MVYTERKIGNPNDAARTMLADSLLPIPFWAEAVNTACYVLNRVLVTKPQNKTPYELLIGTGPNWMFDLDLLTNSMNYIPVSVENQDKDSSKGFVQDAQAQTSKNASPDKDIQDSEDVFDKEGQHQMPEDEQVWQDELEMMVTQELVANAMNDESRQAFEEEKRRIASQKKAAQATSANADESSFVYLGGKIPIDASTLPNADLPIDPNMPDLEDASDTLPNDGIFNGAYDDDEDVGAVADFYNMDNTIAVSPIPTLRIHKDHLKGQILGDPTSAVQTREQNKPQGSSELFVWILVDLPFGKKAIGTKWVFRNKRDERSIVVKNKARLVAQGHRQEEGIDYDEVFAPVARIEAIRLFFDLIPLLDFPCLSEPVLTGNQQLVDVNFLVEDSYLGSARSRQLWQILLLRQNMLQLLIAMGKPSHQRILQDLLTKGFDVTRISMDLRMDRCSPGKYYSSMVWDIVPLLPAMLAGAAVDQAPHSPPHSPPYSAPLPEVTRINSLEKELKETKQTLGNDVLKLVKKVKSLEKALKRKSKKVLISESEGEEPEDQGRKIQDIDDDPLVSLVRESMKEKSTQILYTPTKAAR
ncbi:putative ribonuclease H-like domain-containing protein [Tanacetum coccineum]